MTYRLSWFNHNVPVNAPACEYCFECKSLKMATIKAINFLHESEKEASTASEILVLSCGCWATLSREDGVIVAWLVSDDGQHFTWKLRG